MDYSFNTKIAVKYGVEEAVFIHNLYWWLRKNEANGRHYYDGKTWTYNSKEAFAKLFPFWSEKQLRRIVKNLKEGGAILIGNYNTNSFDRTLWYALSDDIYAMYGDLPPQEEEEKAEPKAEQKGNIRPDQMGKCDLSEQSAPFAQMGRPIPDSKPYNKPNINYIYNTPLISPHKSKRVILEDMVEDSGLPEDIKSTLLVWLHYKKHSYQETGFKVLLNIIKGRLEDFSEEAIIAVINESMSNTWKGIAWDRLEKYKGGKSCGRKLGTYLT